jgi:hypothetical protein
MTEQELKQSGRQGVYRADVDDFLFDGEEPAPVAPVAAPIPVSAPAAAPIPNVGVQK